MLCVWLFLFCLCNLFLSMREIKFIVFFNNIYISFYLRRHFDLNVENEILTYFMDCYVYSIVRGFYGLYN